jgi:hypothetical protein
MGLRELLRQDHGGEGEGEADMRIREPMLCLVEIKPQRPAQNAVEADDFALRFENWRRWCIQKGFHRGHCGSVEGAYRSPQHWDPPEPRPASIDLLDAVVVNRAYTRLALIAPYLRPTRQAQILGTHYLRLDELLHTAKQMLSNQLRMS